MTQCSSTYTSSKITNDTNANKYKLSIDYATNRLVPLKKIWNIYASINKLIIPTKEKKSLYDWRITAFILPLVKWTRAKSKTIEP